MDDVFASPPFACHSELLPVRRDTGVNPQPVKTGLNPKDVLRSRVICPARRTGHKRMPCPSKGGMVFPYYKLAIAVGFRLPGFNPVILQRRAQSVIKLHGTVTPAENRLCTPRPRVRMTENGDAVIKMTGGNHGDKQEGTTGLNFGTNGCPPFIYSKYSDKLNAGSMSNSVEVEKFLADDNGANRTYMLKPDGSTIITRQVVPITSCNVLLDDDIIDFINDIMKYIRIIVPILLLVFGVTDFFKATFSHDENAMIENRKKFFKRIIAAVIVFIVPVFVNLILKLANSVWSNISPDTCVAEDEIK